MPTASTFTGLLRLLLTESDGAVRTRLLLALALVAAGGLLTALAPLALKGLVDALAAAPARPAAGVSAWGVLALAAAYLAALGLGRLLAELRPRLLGAADQRLQARLSQRCFAHLLELPASFHLNHPTGALSHSLSLATVACQMVVANLLQVLPVVIELVTVVVVLRQLGQPDLAGVFVASGCAYAVVFWRGTVRVRRCSKAVSSAAVATHATLSDALLNVETIKCFNGADQARQRFGHATQALESHWCTLHRQRSGLGLEVAAVFAAALAAALFVAVGAVESGSLSIGGFVLATVYMLQMTRPLETLGAAVRDIGQAIEFIGPLLDVLAQPVEAARGPHAAMAPLDAPGPGPVGIHLSQVQLRYPGGPRVLDGLNLQVPAGSSLAIVGPSGSGKSSIARLLLRLVEPEGGCIRFGGIASVQLAPADIRALIGVVPQDVLLFDDSIAFNLAIGRPGASQAEIETACRAACIHDFIRALPAGYDTRVGERGLKLSGGERQRLAIARALLKRPRIFLLDEATSALDARTETEVLHTLAQACAGCTTVLITHRLSAARRADRIACLDQGRAVEVGSHDELLARGGAYARLWQLQAQPG